MRYAIRAALLSAGALIATSAPAPAWDYPGHRMVGAIADFVMSTQHPKAYRQVMEVIAGKDADGKKLVRTLSQVAVFPDCAKSNNVPYCGRMPSDEEKNYVSNNKNHAGYHFTDVPIQQTKYAMDGAGISKTDVVHMVNYTVGQLRGKYPHISDDVKLSTSEAVWLLAHLVGDIHMPLHVGALYYDKTQCTQVTDPTGLPGGTKDVSNTVGGNAIKLLAPDPVAAPNENLHLFWDGTVVNAAMQAAGLAGAEQDFARLLASTAPANWKTNGDPEKWAEQWATEIMPLASSAFTQLSIAFKERDPEHDNSCVWMTQITPAYSQWATERAREQLQKAGFRLAALLTAIFEPQ